LLPHVKLIFYQYISTNTFRIAAKQAAPLQEPFRIDVQTDVKPADVNTIVKALTEFNASQAGGDTPHYLVITVRDGAQNVVGGLVGATYLGWLQIQAVWMAEALRGLGYGTRLMRQAEDEAHARQCPRVFLETLSFQALPFYEKLGYRVVSRIDDFPPGGGRYALTKMLERA
jgi:ribosomal protein S18 acetylase RimI-like enzyme